MKLATNEFSEGGPPSWYPRSNRRDSQRLLHFPLALLSDQAGHIVRSPAIYSWDAYSGWIKFRI